MGQMHHWAAVLEGLEGGSRAMAPDLPMLQGERASASLDALARHVVGFMDALEVPRAVVGGNSLGGHVALRLALKEPERVTGLILAGSSGLFERGFSSGVPHRPDRRWVREKMEEVFFDSSLVTEGWVEEAHRVVTTPASALRVLRLARDARRDNLEARLGRIRVPTLLVWGREDRITPLQVGEREGHENRVEDGQDDQRLRGAEPPDRTIDSIQRRGRDQTQERALLDRRRVAPHRLQLPPAPGREPVDRPAG